MKKHLLVITSLLVSILSIGQTNRYDQSTSQPYVSQYQAPNWEAINKAAASMQEEYEKYEKYCKDLIIWVSDLKSKVDDRDFQQKMDSYYSELKSIQYSEKYYSDRNKLKTISQNVETEISILKKRRDEEPKRLWESSINNIKEENFGKALNDLNNFIELSPNYLAAYSTRGYVYSQLKKYNLSLTDFNKYIELKTDDAFAYTQRGWVKYYLKDYMGALSDFNKEIELEPTNPIAYYNRGSAKSELGDPNGAISDYTKSITLDPNFSMAYNNRGWSKYLLKKYQEALKDLDKAIELDPTNDVAYDSRQETKFAMNDMTGCIADCNKAISLNPDTYNTFFFRGRAYFKQGNKVKACEDWSKSGELGNAEAYGYISKYCK